ncbi:MAG: DUF4954 family protein [Planctomycetes bacterium]|nr:DUF4954 family protein [Planctomycetota bacterium]
MKQVNVLPVGKFGRDFIPADFLPEGKDEYYLRNEQSIKPANYWRNLLADEIEALVKNANTCEDWDSLLVTDAFEPHWIKNCEFSGLVRIGKLENVLLTHHDLQMPAGITNSRIISCDIGDNCAIHDVRYLGHYIIGDRVMLLNIDEMHTSNHAKFGNGILKDGEQEEVRTWMDLINETGTRAVMPFDGMTPADAYIWAKYRQDATLQKILGQITQNQFDSRRGFYGTVGDACVVKSCRIIKDVKIGPCCYVKGANKLKNLTINSSEEEPTQIGEGVELVNGIIGLGCRIFYGCKAVRFIMCNNTNLKYGARLIHSLLGDNSTVSCCEMLHNLMFPAHEQHHNNSFLTASLLLGQSNLAAGATVGSNHNSRANDGEIQAGRGFWPGLCVTLKHCCRFASFALLVKGDYPAELDIPLPFTLISNDVANDRLVVMPAFWWMYNMYALARNTWKFNSRDNRRIKTQNIEFDSLAPDTAEEMFTAMTLLERWIAKAYLRDANETTEGTGDNELAALGKRLLMDETEKTATLEIVGENMENSNRKVLIPKASKAYHAYRQMLHYYAMTNLLDYRQANMDATLESMCQALAGPRQRQWVNLGGQLVTNEDVEQLLADIKANKYDSWPAIHQAYDRLWEEYPAVKQRHAFATLMTLLEVGRLTPQLWNAALQEVMRTKEFVCEQVYLTRKKDYENAFRQITFSNADEMTAVMGKPEDNSFVKQVRQETEVFRKIVSAARF